MINGYILMPRHTPDDIRHAAPCTREVCFYLIRKANFADSKDLKRGQLIRSYGEIQEDLAWKWGNGQGTYSLNQIRGAFATLKKIGVIRTKKRIRSILITVCNYDLYQNPKSYGSHSGSQAYVSPEGNNDKGLELKALSGSQGGSQANPSGSQGGSHSGSQADDSPEPAIDKGFQPYGESGSQGGSHLKSHAMLEYTPESRDISIDSSTEICPPPQTNDCDFDRDRKIFVDCFPGVKTIQTFDDNAGRKSGALVKLVHCPEEIPYNYQVRLEELNEQGAGIYLTVNETNGQGRKAEDVVNVRAVFADLDGAPIDPVWGYHPSIVIESSPEKYHAYWLTIDDPVDGVPLDGFRQLQECIAVKFGSDPKVKDLPRVMRIPGFNHRKGEPFLSRIIHHTGVRYTYADLVEMFPPAPREKWSAPKYQTQTTHSPDTEFKGGYGAAQGGRNNHIAARIGGMLNRGLSWAEIEAEAHKEGAACAPPLSGREVEAVLKSMKRYA